MVTSQIANFDYPSSYDKTTKHVITFFIIFILKMLKPTTYNLGLTSYDLGLSTYGLRLTTYELRLQIWGPPT